MNNKKILYIALAAIAVVLVAVLVFVFAGNNGIFTGGVINRNFAAVRAYGTNYCLFHNIKPPYVLR